MITYPQNFPVKPGQKFVIVGRRANGRLYYIGDYGLMVSSKKNARQFDSEESAWPLCCGGENPMPLIAAGSKQIDA